MAGATSTYAGQYGRLFPDLEPLDCAEDLIYALGRAGGMLDPAATAMSAIPPAALPANFQGSPETAAAAAAWFATLGRTTPGPTNAEVPEPHRLGNCATAPERRVAYTLISTDLFEAAMAAANAWPLLARGGGIELRELPILTPGGRRVGRRPPSANAGRWSTYPCIAGPP